MGVVGDLVWVVVDGAVEFDAEAFGGAVEVEDVGADAVLASEFASVELFIFQEGP